MRETVGDQASHMTGMEIHSRSRFLETQLINAVEDESSADLRWKLVDGTPEHLEFLLRGALSIRRRLGERLLVLEEDQMIAAIPGLSLAEALGRDICGGLEQICLQETDRSCGVELEETDVGLLGNFPCFMLGADAGPQEAQKRLIVFTKQALDPTLVGLARGTLVPADGRFREVLFGVAGHLKVLAPIGIDG